MITGIPALYEIAKRINFRSGFAWTDPRSGITYKAPKKKKSIRPKLKRKNK